MDTLASFTVYALSIILFLVGSYALFFGWLPVPAKSLENRLSRGAGARIAGLVLALALPQVFFIAPGLGRGDVVGEGISKHTEAVLEGGREFHRLAQENLPDREETKESLARREGRNAEMARLNERLKAVPQEQGTQFAQQEVRATRAWQWKILAACLGLGILIGRYTGTDTPGEEPKPKLKGKS